MESDRHYHANPQLLYNERPCLFCYQFTLTGEHEKACPGRAADIRTWTAANPTMTKDGGAS